MEREERRDGEGKEEENQEKRIKKGPRLKLKKKKTISGADGRGLKRRITDYYYYGACAEGE